VLKSPEKTRRWQKQKDKCVHFSDFLDSLDFLSLKISTLRHLVAKLKSNVFKAALIVRHSYIFRSRKRTGCVQVRVFLVISNLFSFPLRSFLFIDQLSIELSQGAFLWIYFYAARKQGSMDYSIIIAVRWISDSPQSPARQLEKPLSVRMLLLVLFQYQTSMVKAIVLS